MAFKIKLFGDSKKDMKKLKEREEDLKLKIKQEQAKLREEGKLYTEKQQVAKEKEALTKLKEARQKIHPSLLQRVGVGVARYKESVAEKQAQKRDILRARLEKQKERIDELKEIARLKKDITESQKEIESLKQETGEKPFIQQVVETGRGAIQSVRAGAEKFRQVQEEQKRRQEEIDRKLEVQRQKEKEELERDLFNVATPSTTMAEIKATRKAKKEYHDDKAEVEKMIRDARKDMDKTYRELYGGSKTHKRKVKHHKKKHRKKKTPKQNVVYMMPQGMPQVYSK